MQTVVAKVSFTTNVNLFFDILNEDWVTYQYNTIVNSINQKYFFTNESDAIASVFNTKFTQTVGQGTCLSKAHTHCFNLCCIIYQV